MTAGDIKDAEGLIVVRGTFGATVAVGKVVHIEADDAKWDPVVDADLGKCGVAITGGADTEEGSIVLRGKVEVTASGATIKAGELVCPASTGCVKKYAVASDSSGNTVFGTALDDFDASGNGVIFVGLR